MAEVRLRKVDDETWQRVKSLAALDNTPITETVVALLKDALARRRFPRGKQSKK